jgi:uncharacterized protein (DUF2252 family)
MTKNAEAFPFSDQRRRLLEETRNLKMARSEHCYVRGATGNFYQWLDRLRSAAIPEGPPIWICGDCHVGNLGPTANHDGAIEVQIRDLDQTVIGNPAHDLLRLALSLASSARGSDLPGVTTALMIESILEGYQTAFADDFDEDRDLDAPRIIRRSISQSAAASWSSLAEDRIDGPSPSIPLGKKFWPVSEEEKNEIVRLVASPDIATLATMLRARPDGAKVKLIDSAFWMKGCSSLGLLRFAAVLSVGSRKSGKSFCLMDFKQAADPVVPHDGAAPMPASNAQRVVEGARHLSPHLGHRMRAVEFLGKSVVVRELLPQDLKLDIDRLPAEEAIDVAKYLGAVVGKAHSRQLDGGSRRAWLGELRKNRTRQLDAPTWLWKAVVELLAMHEKAYLDHCRRYALGDRAA